MKHSNLLLIDDDPISLQLLKAYLKNDHYHITLAQDGEEALEIIRSKSADFFSCIVSDYLMPKKNGIELLQELKNDAELKTIPFILQTSADSSEEIQRGLAAGAFYYLIKPVTPETLLSVVQSAIKDYQNHQAVHSMVENLNVALPLLQEARFTYRTVNEARNLSSLIGCLTEDPNGISVGFFEIMVNAVEHGNLGITYDEKTQLINDGKLHAEIEQRLNSPDYQEKFVTVNLRHLEKQLEVEVTDMGAGFNFEDYMEFSLERAMDNHGRGIMMANGLSFEELNYSNGGRTATCISRRLAKS